MDRLTRSALAVALFLALAPSVSAGSEAHQRFKLRSRWLASGAGWLTGAGNPIVFGSGKQVAVAETVPSLRLLSSFTLEHEITDAVLAGRTLYLVEEGRRLSLVDLDSPALVPQTISLTPAPRGKLRLSLGDGCLIVLEDGWGLRLLELSGHHHHGGPGGLEPQGVMQLPHNFAAVAAAAGTVYLALDQGAVIVVDTRDPARPRWSRTLRLDGVPSALAATASSLYALGAQGLMLLDLGCEAGTCRSEPHPTIRGRAIQIAGRRLIVSAEDQALLVFEDGSPGPQLHNVSANSNFFSPSSLSAAVGDTVRWSNVTGDEHNVFSCTKEQTGCSGMASNESFGSGSPSGFWVYSYTFTQAGFKPYTCLPHAAFMTGSVTVEAGAAPPPAVPDGVSGVPMTVSKLDPAGSSLAVSWDVTTCTNAANHQILYGGMSGLPKSLGETYFPNGSLCAIGASSPYTWSASPDASSEMIWWLILATDGKTTEGSWGQDSAGNERSGPAAGGASAECGIEVKDLTNHCGQ